MLRIEECKTKIAELERGIRAEETDYYTRRHLQSLLQAYEKEYEKALIRKFTIGVPSKYSNRIKWDNYRERVNEKAL